MNSDDPNQQYINQQGFLNAVNGNGLSGPVAVNNNGQNTTTSDKRLTGEITGNKDSGIAKINPITYEADAVNNFASGWNNLTQNNFQATGAPIQAGTNAQQLNNAYGTVQGALGAQGNFVNQLAAQNGIQNQSANYNALNNVVNGTGYNPAQAMLAQQTSNNVANQAALLAGQRGASANGGLMARQAAMAGGNLQQQAVGQAATNQANQSLNALNAQSGIAQNQVNQLGQGLNQYGTAAQNEQNTLQGTNNAYNNSQVAMQSNLNTVNGQISQGNQKATNDLLGGLTNSVGKVFSMFADGGEVGVDDQKVEEPKADFGSSDYTGLGSSQAPTVSGTMAATDTGGALSKGLFADGGQVQSPSWEDAIRSAGDSFKKAVGATGVRQEDISKQSFLKTDSNSGPKSQAGQHLASNYKAGGKVPGKAPVKGDSFKNDKVRAMLSPGEIVLPRSVTQSKDAAEKAKAFVEAIMARKGLKK